MAAVHPHMCVCTLAEYIDLIVVWWSDVIPNVLQLSTRAVVSSGRRRTYDQSRFCRDDWMVWIKGLNERDRGRKMENWRMKAVEEVFGFMYNDNPSSFQRKDIGPEKPNVCYLMPDRFFTGSLLEFSIVKADLEKQSKKRSRVDQRGYGDLGQRLVHPCRVCLTGSLTYQYNQLTCNFSKYHVTSWRAFTINMFNKEVIWFHTPVLLKLTCAFWFELVFMYMKMRLSQ